MPNNNYNKVATTADRLREAMTAAGKKQADLVRETGLDRGSISSYLAGKYEPKQMAVHKMAQALNVSEMWLLGYDVPMARSAEQKKNDDLVRLIALLRKYPDLLDTAIKLSELPAEDQIVVKSVIASLGKK